jgi:octaprenyl-diphosphate synthase
LGKKSPHEREQLRLFGDYLGIAFQLVDDALDYAASQEALGKTVGDDFREGKVTLPIILAFDEGTQTEKEFWNRTIQNHDQTEGDLAHAMQLIAKYNTISRTIDTARDYCTKAATCLDVFEECAAKEALIETLDFCVNREF